MASTVTVFLTLALAACSTPQEACTDLGSATGVSVSVDGAAAHGLDRLDLRVCTEPVGDRRCDTTTVRLEPGSDALDQGCAGTGPDAACSATVVPDGSLVGFVDLAWLTAGPVTVTATTTRSGRRADATSVTVPAEAVYPNGRDCGSTGVQARVTLGPDGLR